MVYLLLSLRVCTLCSDRGATHAVACTRSDYGKKPMNRFETTHRGLNKTNNRFRLCGANDARLAAFEYSFSDCVGCRHRPVRRPRRSTGNASGRAGGADDRTDTGFGESSDPMA